MIHRLITRSGLMIAVLVALVLGSFAMTAQAATGLTIQPIKVSQTMKPGTSVSGTILLSNASSEDVIVDVSVQDFIPTAGTETFQFVGRAPGVTTVRDWITVKGPQQFTFKQGESKQIEYVIDAPQDAEPGSHFGVFFFKATKASEAESQIKVGTQVGVLAFVTIPGKFEQKGTILNFSTNRFVQKGPVDFSLEFENTGTVHFEPKGMIDITNIFGTKVGSVPIEGYAVLPTGVKKLGFSWNVVGLLLGKYNAVASIYDTEGNLLSSSSTTFYAMPVWYIVGFVVTVLILFLVIRFIKSRFKFSISLKK